MAALRFGFSQNAQYINDDINHDEYHSNPNNIALHQNIIASHNALYHHVTNTFYGEYRSITAEPPNIAPIVTPIIGNNISPT